MKPLLEAIQSLPIWSRSPWPGFVSRSAHTWLPQRQQEISHDGFHSFCLKVGPLSLTWTPKFMNLVLSPQEFTQAPSVLWPGPLVFLLSRSSPSHFQFRLSLFHRHRLSTPTWVVCRTASIPLTKLLAPSPDKGAQISRAWGLEVLPHREEHRNSFPRFFFPSQSKKRKT